MGKNQDPGSGINIPDPQYWSLQLIIDGPLIVFNGPYQEKALLFVSVLDPYVFGPLLDPDPYPLVKGMDPDPDPFITKQK
jgi:hypothetical protein